MKIGLLLLVVMAASVSRSAGQVTVWSTDIAPVIYDHCTSCHHEGGLAPFSLMTYDDALTYGYSIQTYVNAKLMPPWPPDPEYSHMKDENILTDSELDAINDWVNNGMASGDLNVAPAPPVYNGSALMINPDETVHLPIFTVPLAGNTYWRFVNPTGYTESKYINAAEFIAGSPSIVHHLNLAYDTTGVSYQDDLDFNGPGFPSALATGDNLKPFMAQSEGRLATLPPNMGFEIPAGSDYVTEIHYYTYQNLEYDSSRFHLKFCTVPDVRPVTTSTLINGSSPSLLDGPFLIPANSVKTFHMISPVFEKDQSLIGLGPHAHMLCQSWLVYMVTPALDTVPLISIPKWDFDWQGVYMLTKVIKIPQGSIIYAEASYDNTVNNPDNPNNPPVDVENGPQREDEMAKVHFWIMDYKPGDEDIILDSTFYLPAGAAETEAKNSLLLHPNPATTYTTITCSGYPEESVQVFIRDLLGNVLHSERMEPGKTDSYFRFNTDRLPAGMYLVEASRGDAMHCAKLIVQ